MLSQTSFSTRLIVLTTLMGVVSAIDFLRNGRKAAKFREYGFILLAGALGGTVGWINDLITSSISPDYFVMGKGLLEGETLRREAGLYGCRTGVSAGIIGGAICLFVTVRQGKEAGTIVPRLLNLLWLPVLAAVGGGILFPLCFSRFDPAHLSASLSALLDAGRTQKFLEVWWIHCGLYAGLLYGLVMMIAKTRRAVALARTIADA